MGALLVVERQVFRNGSLVRPRILLQVIQTFFLDCAVEPLEMCIVIRSANPAVAMRVLRILRKPLCKLRSMVALEHLETKRRTMLRFVEKLQRSSGRDLRRDLGVRPAAMHIEEGIDVESLPVERVDVDRIQLHQIASGSHIRTMRGAMNLLPFTPLFRQSFPLQDALDGAQAHNNALLPQEMLKNFGTATVLQAKLHDSPFNLQGCCVRTRVRTAVHRRDDPASIVRSSLRPFADGSDGEACVP